MLFICYHTVAIDNNITKKFADRCYAAFPVDLKFCCLNKKKAYFLNPPKHIDGTVKRRTYICVYTEHYIS